MVSGVRPAYQLVGVPHTVVQWRAAVDWSDDEKQKLMGLPSTIRPGDVDPEWLREMVVWLQKNKEDPQQFPKARLYDKKTRPNKPIPMIRGTRVWKSREWVRRRLIPNFKLGELDWVLAEETSPPPVTDQEVSADGTSVRGQAVQLTNKLEAESGNRYEKVGLYARRLRRIICQMWVPEPENVPLDRVPGVGFYDEDAGGTLFRWEQRSDGRVISWVDADTERWLYQEFLPLLGDAPAREIAEEWQGLQQDMNRYLNAAAEYQFALREVGGYPPLDRVRFASPATSALPEDHVEIQEARFLIEEFPRLRGRAALMRDRLDDALASLGADSNT